MNVIYGLSNEVEVLRTASGTGFVSVNYDTVKHPFVPFIISPSGVVDPFSPPSGSTQTISINPNDIVSSRSMGNTYMFRTQFGYATPVYNANSETVQVFNPASMIPDKMTYLHRMSILGLAKNNAIIFRHSSLLQPLTKVQYTHTYRTVKGYYVDVNGQRTYYYEAYLDIFSVPTNISISVPATERTEDRVFTFTISSGNTNFYIPIGKVDVGSFNLNLSVLAPDPTAPVNKIQKLSSSIGFTYNFNSGTGQATVSYSGTWSSIVRLAIIRTNSGVVYAHLTFHPNIFTYFEASSLDVRVGVVINWLQATNVSDNVLSLPVATSVAGTAATVLQSSEVRGVSYAVSINSGASFVVPMFSGEEITYNLRVGSGTFTFSSYYLDNSITTFSNTATTQIDRFKILYNTPYPQATTHPTLYFNIPATVTQVGGGNITYMPLSPAGQTVSSGIPIQHGISKITISKNPNASTRFYIYLSNIHLTSIMGYYSNVPTSQTQDFSGLVINSSSAVPQLPMLTIRKV